MPRGTHHRLVGTLGWDERNHIHVLTVAGGGYWFVDMPLLSRMERLIGREVTVEGKRSGFNMLDVSRVLAVDGIPVPPSRRAVLGQFLARLRVWSGGR